MKVLELFGGIGAPRKALERLNIDFKVIDYVEIDKYAVASYNAIYNQNFEPQDVCSWDKDIEVDLIFHGSPCQDFSLAGKGAGGDENSGTRSSLLYETVRIVEKLKPKYVIWENVKNVVSDKHKHNFYNYLEKMKELGYTNTSEILNAKHYGIPQNRERLFTISVLNSMVLFQFPQKQELILKLKDLLEKNVAEKYYLSDKANQRLIRQSEKQHKPTILDNKSIHCATITSGYYKAGNYEQYILIPEATKKGYAKATDGDGIYINQPHQKRGVVQKQIIQTIKTSGDDIGVIDNVRIRKLTPKECWRLMGFDDESFERAAKVNSNTQLYRQAGNSIVVQVLEAIFKELLC